MHPRDEAARTGTLFDRLATIVALLAVLALGLAAGATLAEGAVLVPYWRAVPAEAFLSWYHDNASRLVDFFGPLEITAAAFAVAAAVLARSRRRAGGGLLILAAVLAVIVLATFPLYFRDVNASFASGSIEPGRVAGELARWAAWHWLRTAIGVAAFAAALLGALRREAPPA